MGLQKSAELLNFIFDKMISRGKTSPSSHEGAEQQWRCLD